MPSYLTYKHTSQVHSAATFINISVYYHHWVKNRGMGVGQLKGGKARFIIDTSGKPLGPSKIPILRWSPSC